MRFTVTKSFEVVPAGTNLLAPDEAARELTGHGRSLPFNQAKARAVDGCSAAIRKAGQSMTMHLLEEKDGLTELSDRIEALGLRLLAIRADTEGVARMRSPLDLSPEIRPMASCV